jgi:predicted anti-sigma-YlaC factor YlaD
MLNLQEFVRKVLQENNFPKSKRKIETAIEEHLKKCSEERKAERKVLSTDSKHLSK